MSHLDATEIKNRMTSIFFPFLADLNAPYKITHFVGKMWANEETPAAVLPHTGISFCRRLPANHTIQDLVTIGQHS